MDGELLYIQIPGNQRKLEIEQIQGRNAAELVWHESRYRAVDGTGDHDGREVKISIQDLDW